MSRIELFFVFAALATAGPITISESITGSGQFQLLLIPSGPTSPFAGFGTTMVTGQVDFGTNGAGVSSEASVQVEADVYTEGPPRPGFLLVDSFCSADGGAGGGGGGTLTIAGSAVAHCNNSIGGSPNTEVPVTLGTEFSIVISEEAVETLHGDGGVGIEINSLQAMDPNVIFNGEMFTVPVDILLVPEPGASGLVAVAFALVALRLGRRTEPVRLTRMSGS